MATDGQNDSPITETVEHPETAKLETAPVPPVTPPAEAHDGIKDLVNGLGERVNSLEETVRGLLPAERDSTPGKRPWTHRKMWGG